MRFLLALASVTALHGAYTYYYTEELVSQPDPAKWHQNGSLTVTAGGLTAPGSSGGSLISKVAVPDGTSEYEVKIRLTLTGSGGNYFIYMRASNDAFHGTVPTGTYYAW